MGVISGAVTPEAGTVRRGRDVRVAALTQDPQLPAGTARAAVAAGWEGDAVLDRLGMSARRDADVAQLSGGEAKRVALAATLAVLPHWLKGGADVPVADLFWMLTAVVVVGLVSGLAAVRAAVRAPLLSSLREE